jgi:hypothetical protein
MMEPRPSPKAAPRDLVHLFATVGPGRTGKLATFDARLHAIFFNRAACVASTRVRAFFPSLAASAMLS